MKNTAIASVTDWQHAAAFVRNTLCLNTRRDYAQEVRLFATWARKPAGAVTLGDLLSYREHLEGRGLKPVTIAKKLTVLRRLFGFLAEQGLLPRNPTAGLKLPTVKDEASKDILTLEECNRLMGSLDASTLRSKRDRAIFALLLINGMRICEICRANISDLRQAEGYWILHVHGKGGKEADTRIRDDVLAAINAYLEVRGETNPDAPLFIGANHRAGARLTTRTVQHMVMGRLEAAGIRRPNLTVHSLRHTAVTLVIMSGASLIHAQEFARHSDPKTTQRYFHNFERLKSHAVMLHPLHLSA